MLPHSHNFQNLNEAFRDAYGIFQCTAVVVWLTATGLADWYVHLIAGLLDQRRRLRILFQVL